MVTQKADNELSIATLFVHTEGLQRFWFNENLRRIKNNEEKDPALFITTQVSCTCSIKDIL